MKTSRQKSPITIPKKNIKHVTYNGIKSRIAFYPSEKKTSSETFVLISGHHTSHERMYSFARYLSEFGDVYCIDVPGFGGVDSFNKHGKDVNFDNYAEYIYTVMKTQKLTKNITIFAISVGGEFVTRMLQKYPETQQWVTRVVGFVTFGAGKDFHIKRWYKSLIIPLIYFGSTRVGGWVLDNLVFNPIGTKLMLTIFSRFKKKMQNDDATLKKKAIQMETFLWAINDHRTQAITTRMMFYGDLRRYSDELINVSLHNIITKNDQYVDYKEVNKTFRDLYADYTPHYLQMNVHMPSLIADKEDVRRMFDESLINAIMNAKVRKA